MNKAQSFQDFLVTQSVHVPVVGLAFNLLLAALLSSILGAVYVRYGRSLSQREAFARNFMLLSMTTMLVIAIVKSSLALSLGLVGALSIVRFRAAIKEPEELAYLFLCIGIGLGLGADQRLVTIVAFLMIILFVVVRGLRSPREKLENMYVTISRKGADDSQLQPIVDVLKKFCSFASLRRFDVTSAGVESAFVARFKDLGALESAKNELRALDKTLELRIVESQSIVP
ncbi:MAG: DUF4956 domain-containing protein [Bdellovibrionales bacterium]|nr:DUF4956 domain-containing protein [Bdellovibrionales bacterium]